MAFARRELRKTLLAMFCLCFSLTSIFFQCTGHIHRSSSTGLALGFTYVGSAFGRSNLHSLYSLLSTFSTRPKRPLLPTFINYLRISKVECSWFSSKKQVDFDCFKRFWLRSSTGKMEETEYTDVVYLLHESWLHPIVPPLSITIYEQLTMEGSFLEPRIASPDYSMWQHCCWLIYIS